MNKSFFPFLIRDCSGCQQKTRIFIEGQQMLRVEGRLKLQIGFEAK